MTYDILVPQQGIELLNLTIDELLKWIQDEEDFLGLQQQIAATSLLVLNNTYGQSHSTGNPRSKLQELRNLTANEKAHAETQKLIEEFVKPARSLKRILACSLLGKMFQGIASDSKEHQALHFPMLVYSDDFATSHSGAVPIVASQRILVKTANLFHPHSLLTAESATRITQKAQELSTDQLNKLKEIEKDQVERLNELHSVYHSKLALEAPTRVWSSIQSSKASEWKFWLGAFVILVIAPLGLLWYNFDNASKIHDLIKSDGNFSVAGLAVVTAPVLLYTWLLRQVSKLFVRSLDLATDAAHRKALTQTFLGLAADAKSGVSQAERAIILQALFRPQPPHLSDDGPPMSLVELLRKGE